MKEQLMMIGFVPSHRVGELTFTIPDKREPYCWDHGKKYWCFFEDPSCDDRHDLRLLEPYKFDNGVKVMYGWTDGRNFFDESSSPMHDDENCVTMFKLQDV